MQLILLRLLFDSARISWFRNTRVLELSAKRDTAIPEAATLRRLLAPGAEFSSRAGAASPNARLRARAAEGVGEDHPETQIAEGGPRVDLFPNIDPRCADHHRTGCRIEIEAVSEGT